MAKQKQKDEIKELTDIVDDVGFLYKSADKKGKRAYKLFKKYNKECLEQYQDEYMHLIIEYQLEAYNCSYEKMLQTLKLEKDLRDKGVLQYLLFRGQL